MINVVLSTVGVFSTMGDIMMHVGKYHEYCGGYHEYYGVFNTMGDSNNKRFPSTVLNTLHGTHDIPHSTQDIPPWYSRYPRTVLKISLHSTQDIHHSTEHPPQYSRYPSKVLKISLMVLMISPMVLITPTVLHTHYTG